MRRIKFRAWDGSKQKMIVEGQERMYGSITNQFLFTHYPTGQLMQYTGLKDKNGKEIYEGDIVQIELYEYAGIDDVQTTCIGGNSGNSNFFADVSYLMGMNNNHIEIIGNKIENPELLEQ